MSRSKHPVVSRLAIALALASTAVPVLHAQAWPADWVHRLEVGKERFVRLPKVEWLEVEEPAIATAEWLADSHELLLTGLKPGRTLLLLGADGQVAAWRLVVGADQKVDPEALAAAQKACPGLQSTPQDEVKLTARVGDDRCRKALGILFQTDEVEARALSLVFEPAVIQAQLQELTAGLKAAAAGKVEARYVGACLVLEGTATEAQHRRALWEVFRRTLGRPALDDRVERIADADAGAELPPPAPTVPPR